MSKKSTKATTQIKVPVASLKIGMYVAQLDKDWLESSFLFQGFLIENERQIKKLQKECAFVFIDTEKSILKDFADENLVETSKFKSFRFLFKLKKPWHFFKPLQKDNQSRYGVSLERKKTFSLQEVIEGKIAIDSISPPRKLNPVEKELSSAKKTHETTQSLIKEFFQQVETGDTLNTLITEQTVRDSMTNILRAPDAMQLLTRLKDKSYSRWQQSMSNAVLAISFGRYLNLHNHELITLGLSGLLHDIGYLRIPQADLEQLSERELIKRHTQIGYEILMNVSGDWAKIAANVAYCHHEHLDGSGLPRGLMGKNIIPYTRIITIVDVYNSLIHPARGDKKLSHYEAIIKMLEKANVYYDGKLLNSFYQSIGTYPVGCLVEMTNGEIAAVIELNDRYKLKPKIMLLTDAEKEKCEPKIVDLAEFDEDNYLKYVITRIIAHPEKYGLNELDLIGDIAKHNQITRQFA